MTNEEWCRTILMTFFPHLVTGQTEISPALSRIAGEIYQDWHGLRGFTNAVNEAAHRVPYGASPGPAWLMNVVVGAARRQINGLETPDPLVRARIQREYYGRMQLALGGHTTAAGLLAL